MDLAAGIASGDRRALARALTLAENADPSVGALLRALRPEVGRARRIGFTGPPGAGKSTLVATLVREARTRGQTVAILAVDPSSPFSQGALLGDRIRMTDHTLDPGVFIRSQASRGALGGLASTAPDLLDLMDAAGFDLLFIETVGVGQSELEVARTADVTVLVVSPNAGDVVQAMKAGLIEAADVLVVNKADLEGAEQARHDLISAFELTPDGEERARRVMMVSATKDSGVVEVFDRMLAVDPAKIEVRRAAALARRLDATVARELAALRLDPRVKPAFDRALDQVRAGTAAIDAAARDIVAAVLAARPSDGDRSR